MADVVVVSRVAGQVRAALVEGGQLAEVMVEGDAGRAVAGHVYAGRVQRVLPGMKAAFVDVGLSRTGFLYVGDDAAEPRVAAGDTVVVQVHKEPQGHKGARLTRQVTLPGRFLVYLVNQPVLAISQRIEASAERERLRGVLAPLVPEGAGFVVRTAAATATADALAAEATALAARWREIGAQAAARRPPALLHADSAPVPRALRELLRPGVAEVVVDTAADAAEAREWLAAEVGCERRVAVRQVPGPDAAFAALGLEAALSRALTRHVWLPCGGAIVIDEAEALTAIDVNSGRCVGRSDAEATFLTINLEAAAAVAHQLRLRDIGGLVVIDFIDMTRPQARAQVEAALAAALARDRARTQVLPMSAFGLVELTRRRMRESLRGRLREACAACAGEGVVARPATVARAALRAVDRTLAGEATATVLVNVAPEVAEALDGPLRDEVAALEATRGARVVVVGRSDHGRQSFDVVHPGAEALVLPPRPRRG